VQQHHLTVHRTARYFGIGPFPRAAPELWYGLHGYAQGAQSLLESLARLDDGSRNIIAPEGLSRFYTDHRERQVAASWMTSEDRLAEIADYVRYLDQLHVHVRDRIGKRTPRVVVLGFSQGAATAARWVALGHVKPERLILWGGLLPPDLDLDVAWAELADSRVTFVVGNQDPWVREQDLEDSENRLLEHEIPYEVIRYEGQHEIDGETLEKVGEG
jgi:predicted esterase